MLFEWYQGISYIVNSFSTVQNLHQHALFPNCFFERQWGINNLWLKKILFCFQNGTLCKRDLVVAPLCLGLQTTYYWKEHWFLLRYCVLDCVCLLLLLKTCFFIFTGSPNYNAMAILHNVYQRWMKTLFGDDKDILLYYFRYLCFPLCACKVFL